MGGTTSVLEVLIRRAFLQKLNTSSVDDILVILEERTHTNEQFATRYPYIKELISGEIFNIQELLRKALEHDVDYLFNSRINCGGYALKIDICIFPRKGDFEKSVSTLLDTFPFVRLLGDTQLSEDEYLVLYRAHGNGGHHFIRVDDDGTVVEKNDCQSPKNFNGWGTLENSPEAVFAVKKEHEMWYFKQEPNIVIPSKTSMNFEETVFSAIKQQQNSFDYHNHCYVFKKSKNGTVYICSNSEIVAEMIIDGDEYDIEIKDGKQSYISNTQPKVPIVIKNGKYQGFNHEEYSH